MSFLADMEKNTTTASIVVFIGVSLISYLVMFLVRPKWLLKHADEKKAEDKDKDVIDQWKLIRFSLLFGLCMGAIVAVERETKKSGGEVDTPDVHTPSGVTDKKYF